MNSKEISYKYNSIKLALVYIYALSCYAAQAFLWRGRKYIDYNI